MACVPLSPLWPSGQALGVLLRLVLILGKHPRSSAGCQKGQGSGLELAALCHTSCYFKWKVATLKLFEHHPWKSFLHPTLPIPPLRHYLHYFASNSVQLDRKESNQGALLTLQNEAHSHHELPKSRHPEQPNDLLLAVIACLRAAEVCRTPASADARGRWCCSSWALSTAAIQTLL